MQTELEDNMEMKKEKCLIEDKMAKIVGNVCMDMLMIDVTEH